MMLSGAVQHQTADPQFADDDDCCIYLKGNKLRVVQERDARRGRVMRVYDGTE